MVPKSGMNKNQMNGLYPIIRRVRRPLLPVDWPTDAKPVVEGKSSESRNAGVGAKGGGKDTDEKRKRETG
jgi:hypothetical protein